MNQQEKLKKLQEQAPQEIPKFLEAAALIKKFDGMSISSDVENLNKITRLLSFVPSTKEGKELKKGILIKAEEKSRQGMFDGMFLMD
jgi:hypothetical protein